MIAKTQHTWKFVGKDGGANRFAAMVIRSTGSGRAGVSGRSVVVAMFSLGLCATGLLFLYWQLHLMPFMPLQQAIAEEFEDSSPRVDGGRRKMHAHTPMVLRIVVRVPFDPLAETADAAALTEQWMSRLRELSTRHVQLSDYEILEVHFYFPVKEKEIRQKIVRRGLSTWQDVDEDGQPTAAPSEHAAADAAG